MGYSVGSALTSVTDREVRASIKSTFKPSEVAWIVSSNSEFYVSWRARSLDCRDLVAIELLFICL
jgi:hypothetical protein